MKILAIVLTALVVTSVIPSNVYAQSIGISPSIVNKVIYRGDVLHESFVLSRLEPEGDIVFSTQEEMESELIDTHDQKSFSIPNGQNSAVFLYDINASTASVGEYDNIFSFVTFPNETNTDEKEMAIQYGLKVRMHISVIERPDPSVTLLVPDYPTLIDEVSVGVPTIMQTSENSGTKLTITWAVENHGKNPLTEIPSEVVATEGSRMQYQERVTVHDVIAPGGTGMVTTEFFMSGQAPSGTYAVVVKVGTHENQRSILVLQPRIKNSLFVIVLSGIATAAIIFSYRRKRTRLGR